MKKNTKSKNKNFNFSYFIIIIILITLGYYFRKQEKKDSTIELLENSKEDDVLKLNLIYVSRSASNGKAHTTAVFTDGQGKEHPILNVGTKEDVTVFDIQNTQTPKGSKEGSELFYNRKTKQIFICIQDGGYYGGLYGYIIKGELTYSEGKWSGGGAYYAANRIGWTKDGFRQWQPAPMQSGSDFTIDNNFIKHNDKYLSPPASTQPNMPVDGTYIIAKIKK